MTIHTVHWCTRIPYKEETMRVEDRTLEWLNGNRRRYMGALRDFAAFCGVVLIAMMWLLVYYVWVAA